MSNKMYLITSYQNFFHIQTVVSALWQSVKHTSIMLWFSTWEFFILSIRMSFCTGTLDNKVKSSNKKVKNENVFFWWKYPDRPTFVISLSLSVNITRVSSSSACEHVMFNSQFKLKTQRQTHACFTVPTLNSALTFLSLLMLSSEHVFSKVSFSFCGDTKKMLLQERKELTFTPTFKLYITLSSSLPMWTFRHSTSLLWRRKEIYM